MGGYPWGFNNRLLVCWGKTTVAARTQREITLPQVYTSFVTAANSQSNQNDYIRSCNPINLSTLQIGNTNSTNAVTIGYITIGV